MPTVGIDIGKQTFQAACREGSTWKCDEFNNDKNGFKQFQRWLGKQSHYTCLEATGRYGEELARYLHRTGHQVSVVNPLRIKCYAQSRLAKNKTDRADAMLIAEFAEREPVRRWEPLPEELEQLRELTRRREHLVKLEQMENNRLKAGFRTSAMQKSIKRLLEAIRAELAEVERLIAELVRRHDTLNRPYKLLRTIPGIGPVCAAALVAEIGDVSRFDSARQLVAYFGLSPRQRTSGSSVHSPTKITKMGAAQIRRLLHMAALSAKQHNPRIKTFCQGLNPKLHKNQVLVAAAHKLLRIVFAVLTYQKPFEPLKAKMME